VSYTISLSRAFLWDVPANGGFVCDKTAMLAAMVKQAFFIFQIFLLQLIFTV
jgi:hypothetical protein